MKLGITGHREVVNPSVTYRKILKYLLSANPKVVNIGGAKGFDSLVMRACYVLNIPYTLYLPHKRFVRPSYMVGSISYKDLYNNASEVFYEAERYHISNYQERNKKIVNNSDWLLVYWDGKKKGGTYNTIMYSALNAMTLNKGAKGTKNIYQ